MNITLDEAYSLSVRKWETIIRLMKNSVHGDEALSTVADTPEFNDLYYGCGYCQYFRVQMNPNDSCTGCPLFTVPCYHSEHLFEKFISARTPKTALGYAEKLLKLIKDTKPC